MSSSDMTTTTTTSSKTNEGGDANFSSLVEASTAHAKQVLRDALSPLDDLEKAQHWLLDGKIDVVHFAKTLPNTYRDIRAGRTKVDEAFIGSLRIAMGTSLRLTSLQGFDPQVGCSKLDLLAARLAIRAIPHNWVRNQEQQEWIQKAHPAFALDFHQRLLRAEGRHSTEVFQKQDGNGVAPLQVFISQQSVILWVDIASPVFSALWFTCQEWSERVDAALFSHQKRKGTFLFLCPTNPSTLSLEEQAAIVRNIYDEIPNDQLHREKKERVIDRAGQLIDTLSVAQHITEAKTCWECGEAKSTKCLKVCAICQVALYCGKYAKRKHGRPVTSNVALLSKQHTSI